MVVGVIYGVKGREEDNKIVDKALKVADVYVSLYKGEVKIDKIKGVASKKVLSKIESKYKELSSIDRRYLDVDKYFYEYGEVGIKEANTYEVIEKSDKEDDPRIFYKDGKPYINLDDLDPYDTGLDGVMYKGVYLKIDTDKYKIYSYEKIKRSLDFKYLFVDYTYVKDSNYVDVVYESVNKENILRIRCYVNNGKVVDIDAEE